MTDVRLNERQRAFAQQHHWVLEDFLKYRHLPMDEFYDVVVFRFLRAVQQYDEREDLRQYSFQTIAGNHMRSALGSYFAKQKRQHEKIQFLSLEVPVAGHRDFTLGDCIADERVDVCAEVCERLCRPQNRRLYHIAQTIQPAQKAAA